MAITSITIGINRNKGNYQSLKIELTSSVGEGENYADEKAKLISELSKLESESGVLFEVHNVPDHKATAAKFQNPVSAIKPKESPFSPKVSEKAMDVDVASKIAAKSASIEQDTKPKANPFAPKVSEAVAKENIPVADKKPVSTKIANPFAPKTTPSEDLETPY